MQNSFINKGLQRTVNRYPVKPLSRFVLNISMGKSPGIRQEKIKDPFTARRYAKLVTPENIVNPAVHVLLLFKQDINFIHHFFNLALLKTVINISYNTFLIYQRKKL